MYDLITIIKLVIVIFLIWAIIRWFKGKRTRYVSDSVKRKVLARQYGQCALCEESVLLEFDHRKKYADGGDNSERNIVALCPKHHAMKTRLDVKGE